MNNYLSLSESFSEIHRLSESISSSLGCANRMPLTPLQEWANTYKQTYAPISKIDFGLRLPESIFKGVQDIQFNISDLLPHLQNIVSSEEPDYVIIDEQPIKEIGIPSDLFFRVGNYRLKMNTGIFISIVFFLLGYAIPSKPPVNTTQVQIYMQTSQQPGRLLESLFDSIDTSLSIHTNSIKSIQEILNAVRQAAEEFGESVGLSDLSDDNFGTTENIEPNRQ